MSHVATVVAVATEHLTPMLGRSGNILYSGASTLRPGSILSARSDPGGDPRRHRRQTLRRVLQKLPSKAARLKPLHDCYREARRVTTGYLEDRIAACNREFGYSGGTERH